MRNGHIVAHDCAQAQLPTVGSNPHVRAVATITAVRSQLPGGNPTDIDARALRSPALRSRPAQATAPERSSRSWATLSAWFTAWPPAGGRPPTGGSASIGAALGG